MTTIVHLPKNVMGKVTIPLTVINRADQILHNRGMISRDQVRSVQLRDILVDTGATTLCLPAEMIEQLGLELLKEVDATTATGVRSVRIFQDAKISLCGREGTFECLELPGGRDPLLGVIPMEMLGLEPNLKHQTLRVLPEQSVDTYLTIL